MDAISHLLRRYCFFESHRLAFIDMGSGPIVLLLHGLGGTPDFWQPVARQLAHTYRVIG